MILDVHYFNEESYREDLIKYHSNECKRKLYPTEVSRILSPIDRNWEYYFTIVKKVETTVFIDYKNYGFYKLIEIDNDYLWQSSVKDTLLSYKSNLYRESVMGILSKDSYGIRKLLNRDLKLKELKIK